MIYCIAAIFVMMSGTEQKTDKRIGCIGKIVVLLTSFFGVYRHVPALVLL